MGRDLDDLAYDATEKRIQQALQSGTTILDLRNVSELPDSIGQLTMLQTLELEVNKLSTLPESLGQLSQLKTLNLSYNLLTTLPESLGQLKQLINLNLHHNHLKSLPESLKRLRHLRHLDLSDNELTSVPEWLQQLTCLRELYLSHNPLDLGLQSAYDACKPGAYEPLWAYLHSLEQNAEPLYETKLVLVGEGNVGKTTLLKALRGNESFPPQVHEPTTHGVEIDIHGLRVPHPAKQDVEIQLNVWDFGGQDVYRVTHQFFFSRRSLYVLVWEPRRGVQQCQVEDWLNIIRLRVGDEARVLIVSTHCKTGERIARIDKPVLQQQYGEIIVGFCEVDSLVPDEATGEMVGVAELKKVIAREAASLEQMGMLFNNNWKASRDELLALSEPRVSFGIFSEVCARHGLSQIDTNTLAHLMHDLGYIVHYSDDEKLRDDVVLKPEWLTKAIGFVLEDRLTQHSEGILPDNRLCQVWHDHPFEKEPRYAPALYPFFLRLMEKYDVSYRLPEERHASLVAQHVPQVRPELPWLPEQEPPASLRRIAMICAMEEDPPGLVPWMIVRTHDFAVECNHHRLHWQKGMFLSHQPHGEAMLEKRGREFHIYAQADWPEYLMNILQHTLQKLITDNWPGLKDRYGFMVPCPEIVNGQSCKGRFKIQALRRFLAEGDSNVRCQECSRKQSIVELLFGFEDTRLEKQLVAIEDRLAGWESRVANYFMALMHAIADEGKNGPRLFTLSTSDNTFSLKQIYSFPLELHLWCEAEGCQHPVYEQEKGVYEINRRYEWIESIAPYVSFSLKILGTIAPIAGPAINSFFGPKTTELWKIDDRLDLGRAILDKIPSTIKTPNREFSSKRLLSHPERHGVLALHRLLNEVDPTHARLGLHRVTTYTGDYRWLCRSHYEDWQSKIPDVIPTGNTTK